MGTVAAYASFYYNSSTTNAMQLLQQNQTIRFVSRPRFILLIAFCSVWPTTFRSIDRVSFRFARPRSVPLIAFRSVSPTAFRPTSIDRVHSVSPTAFRSVDRVSFCFAEHIRSVR